MRPSKRRQIVEGARQVFMAQGFDAASMGEIARAAGVSKGTLYVYFKSKEQLFEAIVGQECMAHAEQIFDFDAGDHDVEGVLTRSESPMSSSCAGRAELRRCGPSSRSRSACPRSAAASTRPDRRSGSRDCRRYLRAQVAAGVLKVEDCEVAAAQFMDSCLATVFKPVLFNFSAAPANERIEYVVKIAVRVFLAAYRAG